MAINASVILQHFYQDITWHFVILKSCKKTEKLSFGGRKDLNLYLYLLVGGKIRLFERTFSHIGGHNGKVGGDNHFVLDVCVCVYDMICHSPLQS